MIKKILSMKTSFSLEFQKQLKTFFLDDRPKKLFFVKE